MRQLDRLPSSTGSAPETRRAVLAEVNTEIRALGERVHPPDNGDWQFWCECGARCCHEPVALSFEGFDEVRRDGLPLIAAGHAIQQARESRKQAAELQAEAGAPRSGAEASTTATN